MYLTERTMNEKEMVLAARGAAAAESARHREREVFEDWRPIRTSVLPYRTWNPALWEEAPPRGFWTHILLN